MSNVFTKPRIKFREKSPIIDFQKVMGDYLTLTFVSCTTGELLNNLLRVRDRYCKKITRMITSNGIDYVCSKLKKAEKQYLLTGKTAWFSLRSLKGINPLAKKVFLSIHRNMVTKLKPDLKSISHKPSKSISRFINKHAKSIKELLLILKLKIRKSPKKLVYTNRNGIRRSFSSSDYSDFTNTIDVDFAIHSGFPPFQITLKSRANGMAIDTQREDFCGLIKRSPNLYEPIKRLYTTWKYLWKDFYSPCQSTCNHISSKLHVIKDKSCKNRVVAILDYYSQIALRPLHTMLTRLIKRRFRRDYTFRQFSGIKYLMNSDRYLYSVDLTSATDTIPCELSLFILKLIVDRRFEFGPQFINDIKSVLTDRNFLFNKKLYRYRTGQPMGAYSSFPLLSLTNHIVALLSYFYVGGAKAVKKAEYAIVGDDIVIGPFKSGSPSNRRCQAKAVATQYYNLMSDLSVPINRTKTVSGQNSFEFCKRIIKDSTIMSFPSWNCHFVDTKAGNPYQTLYLLELYGYSVPEYRMLVGLRCSAGKSTGKFLFRRTLIKNLVRVCGLNIPFTPKSIIRVPNKIVEHAKLCNFLFNYLCKKGKPEKLDTQDPFLGRLNYNRLIYSIYQKTLKKKAGNSFWKLPQLIQGQVFYLSYLDSYHNRIEAKKSLSRRFRRDLTYSHKFYHLCASHKNQWFMI